MSNWYYLMAQLPSFSIEQSTPLPITEEYVTELCSRFLDKKTLTKLKSLSLEPPITHKKTGSILIDSWYKRERQLRFALAQIRALKMKKKHTLPVGGIPSDVIQTARTATGFNNPLEAELFLANSRFKTLESLQSLDAFSTDALFAYVLKLKIAKRIRRFNNESGLASYQNIYKTILSQSTGENR